MLERRVFMGLVLRVNHPTVNIEHIRIWQKHTPYTSMMRVEFGMKARRINQNTFIVVMMAVPLITNTSILWIVSLSVNSSLDFPANVTKRFSTSSGVTDKEIDNNYHAGYQSSDPITETLSDRYQGNPEHEHLDHINGTSRESEGIALSNEQYYPLNYCTEERNNFEGKVL